MNLSSPRKPALLILSLFLLALLLLLLPLVLHREGFLTFAPISAVNRWAADASAALRSATSSVFRHGGSAAENRRLREELTAAREQIAVQSEELKRARSQLAALQPLVQYNRQYFSGKLSAVAASVLSRDVDAARASLTINRGSADGIVRGAAVLCGRSLVGKIDATSRYSAVVCLVSDPAFAAPAYLGSTTAKGVIKGLDPASQTLLLTVYHQRPQKGEYVLTTSEFDCYPPDLVLGVVSEVNYSSSASSYEAKVTPLRDLSELREVVVLRGEPAQVLRNLRK